MTDMTVAETILAQMGGLRRLQVMVGASNFGGTVDSLQFQFKGSRKHDRCRITLDRVTDTYKMEFFKFNRRTYECPQTHESNGLYCDMLIQEFERVIGLHLSLGTMGIQKGE